MYVTAASSNHFRSAKQFINSLKGRPVIFYDIGLTEEQVNEIKTMPVEYRLFDWSTVPDWCHITAPNAGSYAWKPVIIHTVFQENHELIIWCDSGNILHNGDELEQYVRQIKLYTPHSCSTIERWTHETCLNGLQVEDKHKISLLRNAASIGLYKNDPEVAKIVEEWKHYSLQHELISGSRENHRHDQSILSCLFYKYNRECTLGHVGMTIHHDCD
jgi:hypothetical protein